MGGYGLHWGWMSGYGGYGFGLVHLVVWIVILAAVVAGIAWLVRSVAGARAPPAGGHHSAGLDVLEERYARGEINRDEYLQKKRDILG
jgi:putative membrane protein